MFSNGLMDLIPHVIKSWQVLAVTGVLILYIYLVNYVARIYHRPRSVSKSKPKRVKVPSKPKEVPIEIDSEDDLV
jgi:hypothetical protein